MRVAESLFNKPEDETFNQLEKIALDNKYKVCPKVRLSDVVLKDSTYLNQREFDYYTRAHFDFVLVDERGRPIMAVEYDGPSHDDARQKERDRMKERFCQQAGLELLRIDDRHLANDYGGLSLLRWIIEVRELERSFFELQVKGHIPADEPFDPTMFANADLSDGLKYPYWFSAPAIQAINAFLREQEPGVPKGWHRFSGYDQGGTAYQLSFLCVGDDVLHAKTAVRRHNVAFPQQSLIDEINTYSLGIALNEYKNGSLIPIRSDRFKKIFIKFVEKYSPIGSFFSRGYFPYDGSYEPRIGFQFK